MEMQAGDFSKGTFVGRVWLPDVAGPALVALRDGVLLDITSADVPTMSMSRTSRMIRGMSPRRRD